MEEILGMVRMDKFRRDSGDGKKRRISLDEVRYNGG